ncbi:MFS general substrate transporter [Macrolepiota fuliginosa MF-IS2]|uniref:MFS general substrate transporter n=1 Tax=Macrolepiota fuliginosa MF-IS2 TaxID=1400762 RepID=A0A9P5XCF6_9AGAR|nr:MFS general substrate transporter [Macrolepiota fuliginosa MF-IS2]
MPTPTTATAPQIPTTIETPDLILEEAGSDTLQTSKEVADNSEGHSWNPWLIVVGTWLVQFCTYGYVSAFGVYQDYYAREFLSNKTPSQISWIGSVQLFLQYALGVVVGRIYDIGCFHHLIGIGTILQTVSLFMLSLTRRDHYPEVFLAQAVGMGLGQAMLFLPSISVVSHHFKSHRAMATGVAVSGASVGGIVWPILLNQISQKLDFPNAIRVTAAIIGAFLLIANSLYSVACSRPKGLMEIDHLMDTVRSAFCINLGLFFPYFYLQSYALSKGIRTALAFYLLAILNAGSVFGRLLPNFLADKFGTYNMLLPSLYISSGLVFALFGINDFAGLTIFAILYGFWSGSYVSLIPSLLAQLGTHPGELGIRMGIAFSIVAVSLLAGTPIEGLLLRMQNGELEWSGSIIFCGVHHDCLWLSGDDYLAIFVHSKSSDI